MGVVEVMVVVCGDGGAVACMDKGGVVGDRSSASVGRARERAKKASAVNVGVVGAPFSGVEAGAENGA